jgi:hypothetical protein
VAVAAKDTSLLREDWIKQRKKASFYQRTFLFSVHLYTVEQQLSVPVVLSPQAGFSRYIRTKRPFTITWKENLDGHRVHATSQSNICLSHTHPLKSKLNSPCQDPKPT